MSTDPPRPWACPQCGSLLGYVRRNGNHVRELCVFAVASDPEADGALDGEIRVTTIGPAEVTCSRCGAVRKWHVGEDAMQELLRRRAIRL